MLEKKKVLITNDKYLGVRVWVCEIKKSLSSYYQQAVDFSETQSENPYLLNGNLVHLHLLWIVMV